MGIANPQKKPQKIDAGKTAKCHPKNAHYPLVTNLGRIDLHKFFAKLLWLTDALAREPERFFVVQAALLESGDGVAQVRFQFTPVVGREIGLRGEFVPPVFNGGVQIETGLIFHNLHREL